MIKIKNFYSGIILLFIVVSACSQGFEKLPESQIDQSRIELAKNFSDNYFTALKNDQYYEFHDEAIEALSKNLTPEKQKQAYQSIKDLFGDYQSLEYVEAWKSSGAQGMTIIRLKGSFDEDKAKPEIRVVLNEENKIAGFWIKPWADELR